MLNGTLVPESSLFFVLSVGEEGRLLDLIVFQEISVFLLTVSGEIGFRAFGWSQVFA